MKSKYLIMIPVILISSIAAADEGAICDRLQSSQQSFALNRQGGPILEQSQTFPRTKNKSCTVTHIGNDDNAFDVDVEIRSAIIPPTPTGRDGAWIDVDFVISKANIHCLVDSTYVWQCFFRQTNSTLYGCSGYGENGLETLLHEDADSPEYPNFVTQVIDNGSDALPLPHLNNLELYCPASSYPQSLHEQLLDAASQVANEIF